MQGVSAVGVMLLAFALHEMCGQSSASVISIDFGSEWIKVALVKVRHVWLVPPASPYDGPAFFCHPTAWRPHGDSSKQVSCSNARGGGWCCDSAEVMGGEREVGGPLL